MSGDMQQGLGKTVRLLHMHTFGSLTEMRSVRTTDKPVPASGEMQATGQQENKRAEDGNGT